MKNENLKLDCEFHFLIHINWNISTKLSPATFEDTKFIEPVVVVIVVSVVKQMLYANKI